ncbi:hypothetical protein E2C01_062127 [Portunus trituberculatus]|uniref:Uncharacterized protein n=1 Tax=Portunus trituberculatus TaxID=210409 RepID=A0A5B7H740_PORTR|nr:hypothetical protein [Portunus trituberculatus]
MTPGPDLEGEDEPFISYTTNTMSPRGSDEFFSPLQHPASSRSPCPPPDRPSPALLPAQQ